MTYERRVEKWAERVRLYTLVLPLSNWTTNKMPATNNSK
jgi:hypothetical protein